MSTASFLTHLDSGILCLLNYGIRLQHIFEIPSILNGKRSNSIETPGILIKNLGF